MIFDFVHFDTSEQLIEENRAAVEVSTRYRHRETGSPLESTKANLWTLEDRWPNITTSRGCMPSSPPAHAQLEEGSKEPPLPPALQGSKQLRRRIAVGGQPEFLLHVPHPHAGRGADHAVDLAHVIAALGEDLLQ
jgi:hypothetical protein